MPQLIGRSAAIRRVREDIDCGSASDGTILLTGERGVGKKLVARLIHERSTRRRARLVAVRCLGVPDSQLAADLFAPRRHAEIVTPSRVEHADGGTLILDDAGDLSPVLQDTLVHFLGSGEFPRLGASQTAGRVDVRLMATSPHSLFDEVTAGRFRADLYYRLNILHIVLPPLRRRRDDVPVLLSHFLTSYSAEGGVRPPRLTAAAAAALSAYDWPGNVSQLQEVCARLVVAFNGASVDLEALPREVTGTAVTPEGILREF